MIVIDDELEGLVDPSIRKQPTTPPATSAYESAQPLRNQAVTVPQEPQPEEPLLASQSSQPLGPPPAYPGYQSTGYQSFPDPPPPPSAPEYDNREPAGPRFIKAFVVAVLIYILAGGIAGSIFSSSRPSRHSQPWRSEVWDDIFPVDSPAKSMACADLSAWNFAPNVAPGDPLPHVAVLDTAFELSLGDLDLFLMAGPGLQGNITFKDDITLRDTARVNVKARMDDRGQTALLETSVCLRSLKGMSNGVLISSTASDHLLQSLFLDVIVYMPINPTPRALQIPELMVAMASMNLNFNLGTPYEFGKVQFRSNHGNIHVDNVIAEDIELRTLNSAVTGLFSARMFLLRSTNEPVDVRVFATGYENSNHPSEVVLGTTNAPIRAQIYLHSDSSDKTGNYRVVTTTTNAPLDVDYRHIPVNAKLDAFMRTTEAPVYAKVDSAYEGSLQLTTTNSGHSSVNETAIHNADAGSGRHRDVAYRTLGMRGGVVTQGVARWSPSLRPLETMGSLLCATTNHDIKLWI